MEPNTVFKGVLKVDLSLGPLDVFGGSLEVAYYCGGGEEGVRAKRINDRRGGVSSLSTLTRVL